MRFRIAFFGSFFGNAKNEHRLRQQNPIINCVILILSKPNKIFTLNNQPGTMDTTHQEIIEYWTRHQDECNLSVDWAEAYKLCWRCAHERNLQRCHIIPRSLDGEESPSNLVLLCSQCHAEAPNVADPEYMWVWLRAHAVPYYGTYWQQRGLREYEHIFGEKPFDGLTQTSELMNEASQIIEELFSKTSTHWGQGKINPSTWAWVFRQINQRTKNNT